MLQQEVANEQLQALLKQAQRGLVRHPCKKLNQGLQLLFLLMKYITLFIKSVLWVCPSHGIQQALRWKWQSSKNGTPDEPN